ncbi:MAG: hypothetical protein LBH00_05075 [Planctomycetaceae bacterium]|nr:hypothetical protein [Planctomycetaceae bacterium]
MEWLRRIAIVVWFAFGISVISLGISAEIALAKDVRTSWKAAKFLDDLGLAADIPPETQTPEFKALTELASWLAYPAEYGAIPDELTVIDSRELYWRPVQDKRTLYLIRYTYKDYDENKRIETNVGIAGLTPDGEVDSPMTFCHWIEELNELSPEEIYAVYCAGSGTMQLENWQNPQVGLAVLREDNPGFAGQT